MEHVVFFPSPDGAPGFHRFSSLEEALGFVEHKRNVEGVQDVAVCALTPVPVAFRAYYKVEVPAQPDSAVEGPAESVVEQVPDQVAAPAADAVPGQVDAGPVDFEPVGAGAANGKRSLGFFAH